MKLQSNKRSARTSSKKGIISNKNKGLTGQAGLIPVVMFLRAVGILETIKKTINHKRGANVVSRVQRPYRCRIPILLCLLPFLRKKYSVVFELGSFYASSSWNSSHIVF